MCCFSVSVFLYSFLSGTFRWLFCSFHLSLRPQCSSRHDLSGWLWRFFRLHRLRRLPYSFACLTLSSRLASNGNGGLSSANLILICSLRAEQRSLSCAFVPLPPLSLFLISFIFLFINIYLWVSTMPFVWSFQMKFFFPDDLSRRPFFLGLNFSSAATRIPAERRARRRQTNGWQFVENWDTYIFRFLPKTWYSYVFASSGFMGEREPDVQDVINRTKN